MATINRQKNQYTNVDQITTSRGTILSFGEVGRVTSIDATAGGSTVIVAVPSSPPFGTPLYGISVSQIEFRLSNVAGLSGTLTLSVGNNNGGGNNNIMASTVMTGFDQNFEAFIYNPTGVITKSAPGDTIRVNITGVFGGTALLEVILRGDRYAA